MTLPLDESGLGADSLERLKLATALGEAIHLHRSGLDDVLLARTVIGDWVDMVARSLDRFSADVTFRTSGSTGQPKWSVHPLAGLAEEVELLAARFADRRRVISTVPSHHIYGFLFTLLLPARLGAAVIDVRAASPAHLGKLLEAGDLVVAHPDFWAAFVRAVPAAGGGVWGVTSTAPCPPDVANAVRAVGIEGLTEVYGSSETAGIGWRDDPDAPYAIFPFWRRGASDDELIRRLPDGTDRAVRAPDRLIWDDASHVRPAGRHDGAVQIGGHNVYAARVRDELKAHPGVADAAVRLMLPAEGDRLKAFIVPSDPHLDPAGLREELRQWIDVRLTAPERPRSFAFGPRLPTGMLGKNADWPIPESEPN